MNEKLLYEQALSRVEKLKGISRQSFGTSHIRFTHSLYEALKKADNELESNALVTGVLIYEKAGVVAIEKAVENLKADPRFSKLDEHDIRDFAQYFIDQNAAALVFAPEVLGVFVDFTKSVGFPVTFEGAEKGGLEAPRYDTQTLLRVLVGANVLTVFQVPGSEALGAKHSSDEDEAFRANPEVKVDIYELDKNFLNELSHVLRILGVKEESISKVSTLEKIQEKMEIQMSIGKKLEDLESRLDTLLCEAGSEEPAKEKESDDVETGELEASFFKQINDDAVEKLVDGVLIVLGELEQTGEISKIESPDDAKDAVLAAIRRLYQKRGVVSRLSRKYARFGAKKILRKGKADISKALR